GTQLSSEPEPSSEEERARPGGDRGLPSNPFRAQPGWATDHRAMTFASRAHAFLVFILGLLLASCSTLRTDFVRVPSQSLPPRADTASTRYVQAEVDAHGGQSGFRLLVGNQNALMSRIVMIDHARHSIDLQYYIYFN